MMNNKGFTLVELIATIALLAIIAIISFVSINAVIDSSKINECNVLVNNIKSATKEYISDNRYSLGEISAYKVSGDDKKYNFSTSVLVDKKKLANPVINPFDDNETTNDVTTSTYVDVILNSDYTVKNVVIKYLEHEINCDSKEW